MNKPLHVLPITPITAVSVHQKKVTSFTSESNISLLMLLSWTLSKLILTAVQKIICAVLFVLRKVKEETSQWPMLMPFNIRCTSSISNLIKSGTLETPRQLFSIVSSTTHTHTHTQIELLFSLGKVKRMNIDILVPRMLKVRDFGRKYVELAFHMHFEHAFMPFRVS